MHGSVSGHLDYFRISAVVNNAEVNMVHVSSRDSDFGFFLGKYHEVELLDHMVIRFILLIFFIYS